MQHRLVSPVLFVLLLCLLAPVMPRPAVAAPLGTTYYSTGSVAPAVLTNWKANRDGTGSSPANFTGGDVFVIQNGHNMTTSAVWNISGTGSKLWIETGGALTAPYAVTLDAATTFQIDAGGTYVHNNTMAFGSSIFRGTESFHAASTVILNNSNTTGPSSVAFGNLIVNFTSDPGSAVNCGGGLTVINGNLTILSTSTREFRLTAATHFTLDLAGDLTISGGVLNLANGTGAPTINIGGNFTQTGGTFKSSGSVSRVVFTGGSSSLVTFSTSGGAFTNSDINWQIAHGKAVALNTDFGAGSWVYAGRTITVNGTLQINQGAYPGNSGAWTYGPGATLIFNNTAGSYGVGNDAWWPAANGPANVTVQGSGGITMNTARTVGGTFQTAAGVSNAGSLTLNGTVLLDAGGYFNASSPIYGPNSTLVYNTGGACNIGSEWSTGTSAGSGVPQNVTIHNNTAVALPSGHAARTAPGDLTLASGSLTLGGNPGDDLNVKGNWIKDGGAFNANGRAVTFNGAGAQTIGGTSVTTFAYLAVAGGSSTTLRRDVNVAGELGVAGTLSISNKALTLQNGADLNINSGGTVNGDTGALILQGDGTDHPDFINAGTFQAGAGTVHFKGQSATGNTRNGRVWGPSATAFNNVTLTYTGSGAGSDDTFGVDFYDQDATAVRATINGVLTLNTRTFVAHQEQGRSNAGPCTDRDCGTPTYGANSSLVYNDLEYPEGEPATCPGANATAPFQLFGEWLDQAAGPGVPGNVTIAADSWASLYCNAGSYRINGDLTVEAGHDGNSYGGSGTAPAGFEQNGFNLGVIGAATLTLAAGRDVINHGTLKQSGTPDGGTTAFVHIQDAAGAGRYYGIDIAAAGALGLTTVKVSGHQSTCPYWGAEPTFRIVKRCYAIAPANAGTAAVSFYYEHDELNGFDPDKLYVWRDHGDGTWTQIAPGSRSACASGINCSVTVNALSLARGANRYVISGGSPLAVTLAAFTAAVSADGVTLAWETVSEIDNAGFNVYRAAGDLTGPALNASKGFAQTCQACEWVKLNPALIPAAAPGASQGHAYTWTDATAPPGTYWYMLEDVSLGGAATQHPPVEVTVSEPNAVGLAGSFVATTSVVEPSLAALAALAALALAALAGAGLRRPRRRCATAELAGAAVPPTFPARSEGHPH